MLTAGKHSKQLTRRVLHGTRLTGLMMSLALAFATAIAEGRADEAQDKRSASETASFQLAAFSADVTCPLGHPLLGGLREPATEIVDRLYARGFVLLGAGKPIVLCAVDWCEIRNQSYDRWREALAEAAQTSRQRVLVCSIHQHDAPVVDAQAGKLLAEAGLTGAMFDVDYHEKCVQHTVAALREGLTKPLGITHIGTGQAKVEKIASNRRVVGPDGRAGYGRGSASGGDEFFRQAADGLIDPWLKTLSFWNGSKPVAALHVYATHPMSYYGRGGVSADFVGMARDRRQRDDPSVHQIYASGCSGDVTVGKYNDGSPDNRPLLADRLYVAMKTAWKATHRQRIEQVEFRSTQLDLEFRNLASYQPAALQKVLEDKQASNRDRILAAMGLASRQRVASGQKIDFPCIDFGSAQIVLFPGEAFVGYQLMAQKRCADSFVMSIGYGECWPGYIPTTQGFEDKFSNDWYWVAPGSDERMKAALQQVLR